MECLALKQYLDHLLLQPFDLIHAQQGHDILDRVAMRHRKAKQAFVVLLEPYVLAVLVVLVAGTRLEQEHRQAGRQVGGQFILGGFVAAIVEGAQDVRRPPRSRRPGCFVGVCGSIAGGDKT